MAMTLSSVNGQFPTPNSQGVERRGSRAVVGVGSGKVGVVTALLIVVSAASAFAQVPNPAAAINAAKDARARTEVAQQKNAEALDPQRPAAQPQGAPPAGAQPPAGAPAPAGAQGASGAGYTYDPAGRRDPFVSLIGRGGDAPVPGAVRAQGLAGMLIGEVTLKGVLKTAKGEFVALLQSPDNKTYIAHSGDKVMDGAIKAITATEVVFTQDVNDPLSLVKQREVRKAIRPEAR